MNKPNRICANCGKEYYICLSCVNKNSWKQVACCEDCYRTLMLEKECPKPNTIIIDSKETLFKVKTNDGEIEEIIGYDIDSFRFDTKNESTLTSIDIKEFIFPTNELEDLVKMLKNA